MNAALQGAVAEARTWEGTASPCTALLSTLLASKQPTSPLLRGTRKGYSNSFMGQEKREFGDSIIFSLSMGDAHIFFPIALLLQVFKWATLASMSSAGLWVSVCRSELMSPGWSWTQPETETGAQRSLLG